MATNMSSYLSSYGKPKNQGYRNAGTSGLTMMPYNPSQHGGGMVNLPFDPKVQSGNMVPYGSNPTPGAAAGGSMPGSGITGPGGTVPGGSGTVMMNPGTTSTTGGNASFRNDFSSTDLFGRANDLYTQLNTELNKDFSYDFKNDPTYLAAQELARSGAKDASKSAMETMNDRGLLMSSMTNSQLGQIEQKAEMEPLKLIPQLQQQAMSTRNNDLQMMYNMFGGLMNTGMQRYQYDQSFPLQEAAVTGKYLDPKVQELVDTVMQAKAGWKDAGSKQAQDALAKQAANARAQLTAMGIDAEEMFGANVGLAEAGKNFAGMGQIAAPQQAALLNALNGVIAASGQWPGNTGSLFNEMPMFDALQPIYKGLEGQKTMDYQKFEGEMAKIGLQMQGEKLSQAAQVQNSNYTQWLHSNNISEAQAKIATNQYISDIAAKVGTKDASGKIMDRTELFKKLAKDQANLLKNGVNIQDVITAINSAAFEPNKIDPAPVAGGTPVVPEPK